MTAVTLDYKDGFTLSDVAAGTLGPFTLLGGKYVLTCTATFGGGSVDLEMLMPDGTTYGLIGTSHTFTAAGYVTVDLPPGTYQVVGATASAIYFACARAPYRAA